MSRTMKGGIIALIGAAAMVACLIWTAVIAQRVSENCPNQPETPSEPAASADTVQEDIELGGLFCLQLDRSRFFAKERPPLDRQEAVIKTAEADLATARANQKTAEEKSKAATAEAKPAADRELQAFVLATKDMEKKAVEARAALEQLPQRREVSLFIDGVKVPTKRPEVDVRPAEGEKEWVTLGFPLTVVDDASTSEAKDWRDILGGFTSSGKRDVVVGVAASEGSDQPPRVRTKLAKPLHLLVYDPWLAALGLGGLVMLAAGMGLLGWDSGLLRDGGPGTRFSLGRVQMAWWLVLVIGGFLFIWLVSGQWRVVVTSGVVTLLGISASTGVAAGLVNAAAPPAVPTTDRIFWRDLVEDENGVALQRFQLIIWTVILGAIFVWTIFSKMAFPEFDTNLLLLAGIAGATYVGFKFPEKKKEGS